MIPTPFSRSANALIYSYRNYYIQKVANICKLQTYARREAGLPADDRLVGYWSN